MDDVLDERVVAEALERGLVRAGDVDVCRASGAGPLRVRLVLAGLLTSEQVADLLEEPAAQAVLRRALARTRFEVESEIGRGAMGIVHRAVDRESGGTVALKVLLAGAATDDESIRRFRRESRVLAGTLHPNLVPVLEAGASEGLAWFAMPLLAGRTLDERLAEEGPLDVAEALEVTRQVARALEAAHAAGVVHRDVKPSNVFLSHEDGCVRPRLIDFGLAKLVAGAGGESSFDPLTGSGQLLGTPLYMSPEQVEGSGDADARSDVYSLGATLYHMLTGAPPFGDGPVARLLSRILTEAPRPPGEVRTGLDPRVEAICLRCLRKLPGERWPTAGALAEACGP